MGYDEQQECVEWASHGQCAQVSQKCKMSCGICSVKRPTPKHTSLFAPGTEDWSSSRVHRDGFIRHFAGEPPAPVPMDKEMDAYGAPAPAPGEPPAPVPMEEQAPAPSPAEMNKPPAPVPAISEPAGPPAAEAEKKLSGLEKLRQWT